MLKKFLCLVLAAATAMSISVTAFASKNSRRIYITDYDCDEIFNPNSSERFYLQDGAGDSLTKNVDGIRDYSLTAKIEDVKQLNKYGSATKGSYSASIVPYGNSYTLVITSSDFPKNQNENYAEEVSVTISGNKIYDDGSQVDMSSKTFKISFGDGRVGGSDLKFIPGLNEYGINKTDDTRDTTNVGLDPEFIPGINYYFDIVTTDSHSLLSEFDLKNYSISARPYYNSKYIKACEIVKDKNGNLQLHIQADPSYNYDMGKFVKIKLSVFNKKNTSRRAETYYAMGFSFPERDINTDDFSLDQEHPLLVMPNWGDEINFTAKIDNIGNVKFRNFENNRVVNMSYDTDENRALTYANPNAKIKFLTFHAKPSFEVPATVSLVANKNDHVYEIADNGALTEINASFEYGYKVFKTSTLGSYALSSRALVAGKIDPSINPAPPTQQDNAQQLSPSKETPEITKISMGKNINEKSISLTDSTVTPAEINASFVSSGSDSIHIDTYEGNKVRGRFYIDKALASKLKAPIKTKIIVNPAYKDNLSATNLFTKWFENKIMAVTFDQKGEFGASMPVAVKVNFDGFKGDDVYIYRYNAEKNTYKFLQVSKAVKDDLSYFYFNTSYGDTLVMTDGPLKDKAI